METALAQLSDAGIDTMVLKGAPLIELYYRDRGMRPMSDVDIMVPTDRARAAATLFRDRGWLPDRNIGPLFDKQTFIHKAITFRHARRKQELDLHWHLLNESCEWDSDRDFWDGSRPLSVGNQRTRTLNAADMLLHVCRHGAAWNEVAPIRWVADGVLIIRSGEVDWPRLVTQARKHHITLALHDTLTYLRDRFGSPIPDDAIRELARPASIADDLDYRALQKRPGLLASFWLNYRQYWRATRGASGIRGPVDYYAARVDLQGAALFRHALDRTTDLILRPMRRVQSE
jgi:hypothetical protein